VKNSRGHERRGERAGFVRFHSRIVLVCCVALASIVWNSPRASASYFPEKSFATYRSDGVYPLWSENWVSLDPRVHVDSERIPIVRYADGDQYNPVTISLFALRAYNDFAWSRNSSDKAYFLQLARWLVAHQDSASGCWFYEFEFAHTSLGVTVPKHWISAMAQGLAMSVTARAYGLTHDEFFLRTADRALLPFSKEVGLGGVARQFDLAGARGPSLASLVFFEEYPTQPAPSFTLNGFMFGLVGLYDLAQLGNVRAATLFAEGMQTLERALPLFDLGSGTSYDLSHLTRPPRAVHADVGYHLIHITLLNALGTATENRTLLWYRDHWNSYGSPLGTEWIWLRRAGYFAANRYWTAMLAIAAVLFGLITWTVGRRRTIAGWKNGSREHDSEQAEAALSAAGTSRT
jgi:heparosan-N-sulfate-glucuronate 5-epimerase